MPRKSLAALTTFPVDAKPRRLQPPATLTDAERTLFEQIVGSCSPKHFHPSDLSLLISYVQATAMAQAAVGHAATDPKALSLWERAVKLQSMLSTRLRLTPQSRLDPKTVLRNQPKALRVPWAEL